MGREKRLYNDNPDSRNTLFNVGQTRIKLHDDYFDKVLPYFIAFDDFVAFVLVDGGVDGF